MRRALLFCAAITVALACGDNVTEPIPDRTGVTQITPPVSFATTTTEDGLSISTDKDDYQPGDVVHLTGSGWEPGDVLDIVLTDDPLTHEPHRWTVNVGEDGTFQDNTYVVDEGDLNVAFTLVATSRATGRSLTVTFTDAAPTVNSFTLNATTFTFPATPPSAPATNPITVATLSTVTVQVSGSTIATSGPNPNATWKSTAVQFQGGSINFGDIDVCNDDDVVGSSNVTTTSKTFTFSAPATANIYNVRVRAFQGDGCTGAGGALTLIGVLIVKTATSTSIVSSQNPSIVGDPVTFTATVTTGSPATAVTTGQVTFRTGGTSCADATFAQAAQNLVGGQVTYTPSPNLALGSHVIRACYGGTSTLAASENSLTQQVNAPSNAAPVLQAIGNQTVSEEQQLTFTAAADDDPAQTLTFSLSNGSGGSVPLDASIVAGTGVFTWTPTETQGPGSYTFDVCVADNGSPSLSDCETITVTVNEVNKPPVLANIAAQEVNEEELLSFTATATDPDILAGGATNTLNFTLVAGTNPVPSGATISAAGVFSWTPTEAQGPGVYKFKVKVSDDGSPSMFDDQEITVTVKEVNKAPELAAIGNKSVNEGSLLSFTATATDPDLPPNTLTFSLDGAPAGAAITSAGAFTWTPADDDPTGTPSDNSTFKVVVKDDGTPQLSDDEGITVTVNNVKPTIASLTKPDGTALPSSIFIGGTVAIKVNFTDPGTNDTHTAQIDCGTGYTSVNGGANVSTGFETSCTFASIGSKDVKVTVTDDDGGVSDEKKHTILVTYNFSGFFAPVDRPNMLNVSKAGQAIPLKWRLTDAAGQPITDLSGVTLKAVGMDCDNGTAFDPIEEYSTGSTSGLLNLGDGNYQYNWKTTTGFAGTCKSISLVFGSGGLSYTEGPHALFSFKR